MQIESKEEIFYDEDGETTGQVSHTSSGCPDIWSVQGQVGQGFEQPDLVEDGPGMGHLQLD